MADERGEPLLDLIISALSVELKSGVDDVRSAGSLKRDLGMDSINAVNVAFTLEEWLGIEIELNRGDPFDSVNDIVAIVSRCVEAARR